MPPIARFTCVFFLISTLTGMLPVSLAERGKDDPAKLWIRKSRRCLHRVFSIRATFLQETKCRLERPGPTEASGILAVRRGGRYRIDYKIPESRLLVSDGVTAWSYDRSRQMVYTSPARESMMAAVASLLTGEMTDQALTVTFLGGSTSPDEGIAALELIPTDGNRWIRSVVLTLTPDCPCIKRIMVVDHTGCATRITLDRIETNVGLRERHFRFTPPKNARVITP